MRGRSACAKLSIGGSSRPGLPDGQHQGQQGQRVDGEAERVQGGDDFPWTQTVRPGADTNRLYTRGTGMVGGMNGQNPRVIVAQAFGVSRQAGLGVDNDSCRIDAIRSAHGQGRIVGDYRAYADDHGIHGRAPAIATGLKTSNPELDVWVVTGDGDALSIGGNHLIHVLRRNLDTQILLFNNEIYGLTKGQYSPTSEQGKVTKSSPYGSIDAPFNPVAVALGADASFVARTMDRDPKHMKAMMRRAHEHTGSGFLEIYQNCNIFNDGEFFEFTEKDTKAERALFLDDGAPMTYANGDKGLRLDGLKIQSIDLTSGQWSVDDCLVHDEGNHELAHLLGRLFWQEDLPRPFGVIYREERPTYEELLHTQIEGITERKGEGDLRALLHAGDTWTID